MMNKEIEEKMGKKEKERIKEIEKGEGEELREEEKGEENEEKGEKEDVEEEDEEEIGDEEVLEEKKEEVEEEEEEKEKEVEIVEEEKEKEVEIVEEGEYVPKQKPEIEIEKIHLRKEIKSRKPSFTRQEGFRYKRLGNKWRKPKGLHSKMRKSLKYRPPMVKVGYRGPKATRGFHPSGFREIMVHNLKDMDKINPKLEAARIAHSVGMKKRIEIEEKADEKKIRILNRIK